MNNNEIKEFRKQFCEKAAALGIKPSELVAYLKHQNSNTKTATNLLNVAAVGRALKTVGWGSLLAAIAGGATLGGFTAYGTHKLQTAVDPNDDIFGDEADPVKDVKKMNLIAKYRNATNQLRKAVD
jgi:hypothetical protein